MREPAAQGGMTLGSGSQLQCGGEESLPPLRGDVGEPGSSRILVQHRLEPGLQSGAGLGQRHPGPQAAENLHPTLTAIEHPIETGDGLRGHRSGNPERRNVAHIDSVKTGSSHAHDGHGMPIDEHLPANDIGSACQLGLPEVVGEHDHGAGAGHLVVLVRQQPAESGAHSEHGEVRPGDDFCESRLIFTARRQVDRHERAAQYAVEELRLELQVPAERIGHQIVAAESARDRFAFPVDENEAFRLLYREGVEHDLVDEGVDGGGGSDADGEGEYGCCGKGGTADKRARGEAQVVNEVSQPARQPHIAHFFADLGDAADFEGGLTPGLLLRQTGSHQVAGAAVEVVAELAVEISVQAAQAKPVE